MPLSRERTGAMGRALARLRQSRSARPARHGRLAKTLLVALLLVAPVAVWAGGQKDEGDQDNLLHALKRVTMCVDRDSVAVHLDGLTPSRRGGAQKTLLPGVTHAMGALTNRLVHGATLHRGSCVGNAAYLAVDIRITALDPNVYRRYGRHPFSYAIWVQVGQYASPEQRNSDDPTLAGLHFQGFDENVVDENGPNKAVEGAVLGQSEQLLSNLVAAYQMDNP